MRKVEGYKVVCTSELPKRVRTQYGPGEYPVGSVPVERGYNAKNGSNAVLPGQDQMTVSVTRVKR